MRELAHSFQGQKAQRQLGIKAQVLNQRAIQNKRPKPGKPIFAFKKPRHLPAGIFVIFYIRYN